MLQHSTDMYRFPYTSWLQLTAEYGGCSQTMLMSPLTWNVWVHDFTDYVLESYKNQSPSFIYRIIIVDFYLICLHISFYEYGRSSLCKRIP